MRAAGDPLGQPGPRDRTVTHVIGTEDDALGEVAVHVNHQRHQVGIVLIGAARPGRYADLAAEYARLELIVLLASGLGVVLDQPVGQEPARLVGGGVGIGVGIAVRSAAESAADRAELGAALGQVLLGGRAVDLDISPGPAAGTRMAYPARIRR